MKTRINAGPTSRDDDDSDWLDEINLGPDIGD